MIDIKQALNEFSKELNTSSSNRIDAEILLAYVLNKTRTFLYTYPEHIMSSDELQHYQKLIEKRVSGVPIAYLTNQREFWSLSLTVNQHTLIPRAETELLVEQTLIHLEEKQNQCQVLDLGTGSGAIAIALATERPEWTIIASDKSSEALDVARFNAEQLKIENIQFYLSDWFKDIPHQMYDAIISNPPYIKTDDPHLAMGDVRFEPEQALTAGADGLAAFRKIIEQSYHHLLPGGFLFLEHGYNQKEEVMHLLYQQEFTHIQSWIDDQGHARVTGGWRKK